MPRELRHYQVEAVDAVLDAWRRDVRKVAVVMATGLGKSTVIADIAVKAEALGLSVVCLAHRGELLKQMADTIVDINPDLTVGTVQADLDEHHEPIVVASFQTMAQPRRRERLGRRDVILVDEVHHLPAATYIRTVQELGGDSGSFLCGFTATLARSDGGLGGVIDEVVYERGIEWGIEQDYLIPPKGLTVKIPDLDFTRIRTVAGDFQQSQLAEQMEASSGYVADAVIKHAGDRRMIVFAAGVGACDLLTDALNEAGIPAAQVTGESGSIERDASYAAFRSGEIRALVTVQVLTEGVDLPMCDCIVIARPTQSRILFTQMIGRALRPFPGKSDALVLDLAGTTRHIKIVRLVDLTPFADTTKITIDGDEYDDEIPEEPAEPRAPRVKRDGPVDMSPVSLFDSDAADGAAGLLWLRATDGTHFMPGHDSILAVREWGGRWFVAEISTRGPRTLNRVDIADTLPDIIKRAEQYAHDKWGNAVPRKAASWRKRGGPPSDAQLRFARQLNIPDTDRMTKARLSDEISIKVADRALR